MTILVSAVCPLVASAQYTESVQTWSATSADTWQTQSLAGAPFNVPANAVVEVVVRNGNDCNQLWGGVRAVGSSLERRFQLQEAESGGRDRVVMHVQTDSSSQIQHYSDITADVTFLLAGYWTSGTYVERYDTFTAGANASWQDRNLCTYGVRPGHVAEIVMTNEDLLLAREVGVRTNGSSLQRRIDLRNAESFGVDAVSMFVKADTSSTATVELYAEDNSDVDFYLVGYWSVAPRAYTELFVNVGSPTADATWEDLDLTASGVADGAVAQFVLVNRDVDEENSMGVRANGSSLGRTQLLVEAEDDGGDATSTHVLTDGSAIIEFYHQDVSDLHNFWLVGYWHSCDAAVEYLVSDLGAVTSSDSSLAWHINSSENVAGFEENGSGDPDAWYLSCGSFTALGTLGGSDAEAQGINDNNMVVGWAHNGSGDRRAFTWTSGGGMTNLGTVSGRTDTEALSVNGSSEAVGTALDFGTFPSNRLAFLYLPAPAHTLGAGMNSLGTLGGGESLAMDINDSGQVTGGAQNASSNFRPFRWASGTMTNLGTLGGESETPDHRGEAINTSGNVVGRSYTSSNAARAFYYNGSMTNLSVLTAGTESWAFGLNDSNVAVGTSNTSGGVFRAFVWDSTNGMRNLNNLIPTGTGWTLIRATDINNEGFIVGFGTNGSAQNRAFLLTPACSVGGGGSAFAATAAGSGATDGAGAFSKVLVDESGQTVAAITLVNPEPGIKVDFEAFEPNLLPDATPAADTRTRDGFADGQALSQTFRVATTALQEGSSLTVVMTFNLEEIAELGANPGDLEMHVLDTTGGNPPGRCVRAGHSIGKSSPTLVVGESGFEEYSDRTVDYWAVRGAGGTFAVGKPAALDPGDVTPGDPDLEGPHPAAPGLCGIAMLQPLVGCFVLLVTGKGSRRRITPMRIRPTIIWPFRAQL